MPDLNEQTRRELRELIGRTLYECLPNDRTRDPCEWEEEITEGVRELYRRDADDVIDALMKSVFGKLLAAIEGHSDCGPCATLFDKLTKPDPMLYPSEAGAAAAKDDQ